MISSSPPQFGLRFLRYHPRAQLRVRGGHAVNADQLQPGPGDKGDLLTRRLARIRDSGVDADRLIRVEHRRT